MDWSESLSQTATSTLRGSTPLLFAALGGLLSERAGVINIALEGMMLSGAFGATAVALAYQSAPLGILGALCAGILVAALYALFVIELRADQIVAGTAINILVAGTTPFLCKVLYESSTSSPSLELQYRFQSAPLWMAWGLLILVWAWLKWTPSGMWLQFAGEHPEALDSAGIHVKRVRWIAVLMSGCFAALGGASMSIFLASSFTRNMTAGRGFMAIAALIFGKWKPIPTAIACVLFGFSDALQTQLQGVVLWGTEPVPVQFIQILPYFVTLIVLAGFVGKSQAPKALGSIFERQAGGPN